MAAITHINTIKNAVRKSGRFGCLLIIVTIVFPFDDNMHVLYTPAFLRSFCFLSDGKRQILLLYLPSFRSGYLE